MGYGGTKTEMERLLADASAIAGVDYDISNLNDVYAAIHTIQNELHITGTTALEAEKTIEGSSNSMKAAWSNLIAGIGNDNADLEDLISKFIDSLLTYAGNLIPVIKRTISGIGNLITVFAQDLLPQVIDIIISELPELLEAGAEIITAFVNALPGMIRILSQALPKLLTSKIIPTILKMAPAILRAALDLIKALAESLSQFLPVLIPAITECVLEITKVLTEPETMELLINAAFMLFGGILQGLIEATPQIIAALPTLIENIIKTLQMVFPVLASAVFELLGNMLVEVVEEVGKALGVRGEIIDTIKAGWAYVKQLLNRGLTAVREFFNKAANFAKSGLNFIKTAFVEGCKVFVDTAKKLKDNLIAGIVTLKDKFFDGIEGIKTGISNGLDIIANWFKTKFETAYNNVTSVFSGIGKFFTGKWSDIKNAFKSVGTWFKDTFSDAWKKIKSVFDGVGEFFGGLWTTIKEKFTDIGQAVGEAVNGAFSKAVNSILSTATNIINGFIRAINKAIKVINEIPGVEINKLKELDTPQLARGGILKKGQIGLLEGTGAEAVVPLDQNKKWINATAKAMNNAMQNRGIINNNNAQNVTNNYNFTQNNNSPKALNRLEIYRQTKNQLRFAQGG